ncbi:MAG: hypothetical protein WAZ48_08675 [Lysobacteraceae bacterium]
MRRPVLFMLPLLTCLVGVAGCSKPKMPDHDNPPDPQTSAAEVAPPTQLREAMQKPIDKAEAAQASVDAAADAQRSAIDAATGN